MEDPASGKPAAIRVGVLSKAAEPGKATSQGLYLSIPREAGMQARAVSAGEVKGGALDKLDIFIIGGGSGTAFNASLGREGGRLVDDFVRKLGNNPLVVAAAWWVVRGPLAPGETVEWRTVFPDTIVAPNGHGNRP